MRITIKQHRDSLERVEQGGQFVYIIGVGKMKSPGHPSGNQIFQKQQEFVSFASTPPYLISVYHENYKCHVTYLGGYMFDSMRKRVSFEGFHYYEFKLIRRTHLLEGERKMHVNVIQYNGQRDYITVAEKSTLVDLKNIYKAKGKMLYNIIYQSRRIDDAFPLSSEMTISAEVHNRIGPLELVEKHILKADGRPTDISRICQRKPVAIFTSGEKTAFFANWFEYSEEEKKETFEILSVRLKIPVGIYKNIFYSIPHYQYVCTAFNLSMGEGFRILDKPDMTIPGRDTSFMFICFGDIAGLSQSPEPIDSLTEYGKRVFQYITLDVNA